MIHPDILLPSFGYSASLILSLLQITNARTLVQIGLGDGTVTNKLLQWAEAVQGTVLAIDPAPKEAVIKLISSSTQASLISGCSLEVKLQPADLYLIDDDPNYFSTFQLLNSIWTMHEPIKTSKPFLAVVRGVGWPFGQRDGYSNPESIPAEFRHPYSWTEGIDPEDTEMLLDGLRFESYALAQHEGGDCNGVLSAIWSFLHDKPFLKLMNVHTNLGLGIIYSKEAPWAKKLEEHLIHYRDHPLLGPLEEHRLRLMVEACSLQQKITARSLLRQNHGFDTQAFCQQMEKTGGQRYGLGRVSIIIPTHNRPELLQKAIISALQQTYQEIEILVINDAGKEIQFIRDARITYLSHPVNLGPSAARNTGLRAATGKYIAYLDDDDLFHPQHIEVLINALHESGFSVAYSDKMRVFLNKGMACKKKWIRSPSIDMFSLLIRNRIIPLCVLHEKACLDRVGYFDETLTHHEDWDFWIRLAQEHSFFHVPLATCDYNLIPEHTQAMTTWTGYFLNSALIIHQRYQNLVGHNAYIRAEQLKFRDILRFTTLAQLQEMRPKQIYNNPKLLATIESIILHSSTGTPEDIRGAKALASYIKPLA